MTDNITYVVGDATQPSGSGHKIIAHVVNDVGAWGAGFVLALSRRWPAVEEHYRNAHARGGHTLGYTTFIRVGLDLLVANMYAQRGYRSRDNPVPLDYEALRRCLTSLGIGLESSGGSLHIPRIGCGLAGGKWDRVEPIIREEVCSRGASVVVYDLPEPVR